MSVLHSPDRKYPLQTYLQNYDRSKFHNRDVSLSIPYGRLSSRSSSISFSLPLSYPQSWESPPLSFPTVSRLLFSPKFLIFVFLLYLPALSLCPLPAALPEDDQLKQFPPCTSHCNRELQGFCGIPTFPSPNGKMSPSTFPMTQICRSNKLHDIKHVIQYDHQMTKYWELIEEFLPTETLALV